VQALLSSNSLADMRRFEDMIKNAGGTLERDLPTAIANAADQSSRLKNTLREAAEDFARPINDAVSNSIKYLLNGKDQGGLGLSSGQLMGGAAAGLAGTYALARFLPGAAGRLLGRTGGLAAGVAEGKALQSAAGVTPVYVTNWAEMNGGGGNSALGALGGAAAGAGGVGLLTKLKTIAALAPLAGKSSLAVAGLGYTAAGVGLAGAAGYGVGTGIYKMGLEGNRGGEFIGESIAKVLALFGNSEAQRSLAVNDALKNTKVGGEMTIRVTSDPGLGVSMQTKPFAGTRMNSLGQTNQGAGF
jgi:hypothetical protein